MSNLLILDDDLTTELSYLDTGRIMPGKSYTKKLGLENNISDTIADIVASFFPGIKNDTIENTSGYPVVSAKIQKSDYTGEKKVTQVLETSGDGACTAVTVRPKGFLYNGSTYTEYASGDISCMADTSSYLYFGFDYVVRNFRLEFSTAGSYGVLVFEYYNGSSWVSTMPTGFTDGTSGFSADGTVYLGAITDVLWNKVKVNGYSMYWIRVSASSVTTQAIADVCKPMYVYALSKTCLFGRGSYYTKNSDATPVYASVTPTFEYANMGIIVFSSDPTAAETLSIVAGFYYKNPQPGVYNLTFPTVSTCSVNGGAAVNIIADNSSKNSNVIAGVELIFSSTLTTADTATLTVTDYLQYLWYAPDSSGVAGTWQNYDYIVGDIATSAISAFWIKIEPPISAATTTNRRYMEMFFYGEEG